MVNRMQDDPKNDKSKTENPSAVPLREGEDYYLDDTGLMVFTEKYHLKRGHCCENNCRHCPYKVPGA